MEKIVISTSEVAETAPLVEQPARLEPKLPPAVPRWAWFALSPLVLVLPVLCVVTIVLRMAMRGLPPRTKDAWTGVLATLLTVSGLLTTFVVILSFSFVSLPTEISRGLADLDERTTFPSLPVPTAMTAKDVAEKLKPIVAVIAPVHRSWFTNQNGPGGSFGAGVLLQANTEGYLFITARHVIDGEMLGPSKTTEGLVAMASGTWGAAQIVARHKYLDLLLLRIPRASGHGDFSQPLATEGNISEGEDVFVIGHPEGLRYTLSSGIISRMEKSSMFQITAAVSPGNSGGPVFDDKGNLLGIVVSMIDKHGDPNAENLNFAIRADALTQTTNWDFKNDGQKYLTKYLEANQTSKPEAEEKSK